MIDWLKNITHDYPEFWKQYIKQNDLKSSRYVVIYTETSGLNPDIDKINSIGCIAIDKNAIQISDTFEVIFHTEAENQLLHSVPDGMKNFIEYLSNATIIGHRVDFDIEIINQTLDKIKCGRLKNDALDIEVMFKKHFDFIDKRFSMQEIVTRLQIEESDETSSLDNAFAMALAFLKLKSKLGI